MITETIIIILFWIFIYLICGMFICSCIINWEAKETGEYIVDGWRWKEVKYIIFWPSVFIKYIVNNFNKS